MGGEFTDDDTFRKVFKILTGIFLTVFLVAAGLFVIHRNPNITGLAVAEDDINYCKIKDRSILIYVEPDINCKYLDSNDNSVKIELSNNVVGQADKLQIDQVLVNTCESRVDEILPKLGSKTEVVVTCPDITNKNSLEVYYTNVETGLSKRVVGTIGIPSK